MEVRGHLLGPTSFLPQQVPGITPRSSGLCMPWHFYSLSHLTGLEV